MTTIVTISPIIPVGPRISSRSFPRESQQTGAARSALSPSWIGRHAAQYSDSERWVGPPAGAIRGRPGRLELFQPWGHKVPSSALFAVFGSDIKALQIQVAADR